MTDYETLPGGNIRVPLPDGDWAEVRTVERLVRADTRAILKLADEDGIDLTKGMGIDTMAALQDATIVRMTRRWSLKDADGAPIEVCAEAIQQLTTAQHAALRDATTPVFLEVAALGQPALDPKSGPSSSPPAAAES
jgi:hypothetical protein